MHDGLCADIAGRAVADAIAGRERGAAGRPHSVLAVAEAQLRETVVVHLNHEIGGGVGAVEQRALRVPGLGIGA